jgi:diadenosine tetraphosphate (Ap4A) HIT family hydrolase
MTMGEDTWLAMAAGVSCPFDRDLRSGGEHGDFIAALTVSSLYLARNQAYRGACALIFTPRHAARIDQLTNEEWQGLSADLRVAHAAVFEALSPDHMNVALLGNSVPHLHWGITPRYRSDPRWGHAIWTTSRQEMPTVLLAATEQRALIERLREAIGVAAT